MDYRGLRVSIVRVLCRHLSLSALLLLPLLLGFVAVQADNSGLWNEQKARLRIGQKLFPACLAARTSLDARLTPDGKILVLVVYRDAPGDASETVDRLQAIASLRNHPLRVIALSAVDLDHYNGAQPAGVFITSIGIEPQRLRDWSERHQTLVFSPFEGDVEHGAVAGIAVTGQVLPLVNLTQARRAGLRFKPFFLDVAERYEER
jgi:hypothetical protein